MDSLPQAQYIILGAAILTLGGFAIFVYSILKKEQEFQQKEQATFMKYREILQGAQEQARSFLDSATNTSSSMLNETKITNEHLEVELDRILQTISQKHIEKLKQNTMQFESIHTERLRQFQTEFESMSKQMIVDTQTVMTKEVTKAIHSITERTERSGNLLNQQMQETLHQAEQDIHEYKTNKIAAIDKDVREIVERTYREVLRQSTPESVDQKLILEGLEKAKAEGGISI